MTAASASQREGPQIAAWNAFLLGVIAAAIPFFLGMREPVAYLATAGGLVVAALAGWDLRTGDGDLAQAGRVALLVGIMGTLLLLLAILAPLDVAFRVGTGIVGILLAMGGFFGAWLSPPFPRRRARTGH